MTTIKKETRGGARPGAGRSKGEPTKVISFRVPVKNIGRAKRLINDFIRAMKLDD